MLLQARFWPQGPAISWVVGSMTPRFILAALVIAIPCWRMRPVVTAKELRQGLIVGAFAAGGMILQTDGMRFTSASTSAFLTQFYAILIPLWLTLRHRRLPPLTVIVASLLVLGGVAVLGHFDWQHLRLGRGEIETLLCSVVFMGQILWVDDARFAGNRGLSTTLVMFGVCSVAFTALGIFTTPSWNRWLAPLSSVPWWCLTGALTVLCTVATYLIMNAEQPKITATEAGLLYCFEPIFGSLLALVLPALFSRWADIEYPNEHVTTNLLIGGGLITVANLLIQWKPPPRRADAAPSPAESS